MESKEMRRSVWFEAERVLEVKGARCVIIAVNGTTALNRKGSLLNWMDF